MHIVQFGFDEIRVISQEALKNIFKEVKERRAKKIIVNFCLIEEYSYWFYLLNTLKANKENCTMKNSNHNRIQLDRVFDLFLAQLSSMLIDEKIAFNKVNMMNESEIEIECSDYLDNLLDKNVCFGILDELRGKYDVLYVE